MRGCGRLYPTRGRFRRLHLNNRDYNRFAWDRQVETGNRWSVPVGPACSTMGGRFMHPVNPVTPFKLARAKLTKLGATDLAERITFAPRNLAPKRS